MTFWLKRSLIVIFGLSLGGLLIAQYRQPDLKNYYQRNGIPLWDLHEKMPADVFTFARVAYNSYGGRGGWSRRAGDFRTDWPDADLNLSYRLQEMTSMRTHPEGIILRLTDPELPNHPFIYIVEPGNMYLDDEEVIALRNYLLNGGFLMVDDFWGEDQWANLHRELKRVFPDREPEELDVTHEIFQKPFPLKEKPQIPNVGTGTDSQWTHITWEREDAKVPHYRALFDDKGRMMAVICHNTDLGDGWEREGENLYYFREFSEKKAYPLGINIIFYALTH